MNVIGVTREESNTKRVPCSFVLAFRCGLFEGPLHTCSLTTPPLTELLQTTRSQAFFATLKPVQRMYFIFAEANQ